MLIKPHLHFDIKASSLPDYYKQRLLALKGRRISKDGVIGFFCNRLFIVAAITSSTFQ
jgi:hypothetical protein